MTFQEMMAELDRLTFSEQLALMEALSRKLQQSTREIEAARLRGAFGATRKYSDQEIKDMYVDYLTEKYK